MSQEEAHAENLRSARAESPVGNANSANNLRDMAKLATPLGALSLGRQMNPFLDPPLLGIALSLAVLKDLFDIIATASIVFIVLIFILTPVISFFIGLCVSIMGAGIQTRKKARSSGKLLQRFMRGGSAARWGVLFAGTIIELIPIVDSLPLETTIVIITYAMVLHERKMAAEDARAVVNA